MAKLKLSCLVLQVTSGNFIEQSQHMILHILWDCLLAFVLPSAIERIVKLRQTNQYYVLLHMTENMDI